MLFKNHTYGSRTNALAKIVVNPNGKWASPRKNGKARLKLHCMLGKTICCLIGLHLLYDDGDHGDRDDDDDDDDDCRKA